MFIRFNFEKNDPLNNPNPDALWDWVGNHKLTHGKSLITAKQSSESFGSIRTSYIEQLRTSQNIFKKRQKPFRNCGYSEDLRKASDIFGSVRTSYSENLRASQSIIEKHKQHKEKSHAFILRVGKYTDVNHAQVHAKNSKLF